MSRNIMENDDGDMIYMLAEGAISKELPLRQEQTRIQFAPLH